MRKILYLAVLAFLSVVDSRHCLAETVLEDVTKERARELGVTVRSEDRGAAGVKLWLEFKPQGQLKNFGRAELEVNADGKHVVTAPLLASHPTKDLVSIQFTAAPSYLANSIVTLIVPGGLGGEGYRFPMKEFVELSDSR
jgi:hypothetical protein